MVKLSPPRPVKAVISHPVRALDTIYQNTTGRPLLILVTCRCVRADVAGAYAEFGALVEDVTPPTVCSSTEGLYTADNNADDVWGNITFAVPNGYYYQVYSGTGGVGSSVTLIEWTEVEL